MVLPPAVRDVLLLSLGSSEVLLHALREFLLFSLGSSAVPLSGSFSCCQRGSPLESGKLSVVPLHAL